MPRQNDESVQSKGQHRVLNFGAVRFHNGHLQSGDTFTRGCNVCQEGLAGAMEEVEEKPVAAEPAEVAESDGSDEKDDSSLAYGSWPYTGRPAD